MCKSRKIMYLARSFNILFLSVSLSITIFSALRGQAFLSDSIFILKNIFVVAPAILNLLIILFSFYLMLTGVYKWGVNQEGAYSRTLIGLFILHATSKGLPFIPYLALLIEIMLCYRNYRLGKGKEGIPGGALVETA